MTSLPPMEVTMTTLRIRRLVSLAAALAVTLTFGACATGAAHPAAVAQTRAGATSPAIRFTNEGGDYVHVYLVGARREWLLGRVEAGARATLRLPEEALTEDQRWMRLAVLQGARATTRVVDDPRAAITVVQPAGIILSHRWSWSPRLGSGQITSLPIGRPRDGRPGVTMAEGPPR